MPDALRVIFYLWLLTSCVILLRRFFLRMTRKDDDLPAPAPETKATTGKAGKTGKTGRDGAPSASKTTAPGSSTRLRSGAPAPDRPNRALDAPSLAGDGSLVEAVIREEVERKKREAASEAGDTGRAGLFAPLDPAPDPSTAGDADPDAGADRPTVAEALDGIVLPCDLVPMIVDADDPDAHRAFFVTVGVDARIVGATLGDELERLGYTLSSSSATTAMARRDDVIVTIEIHDDAAEARDEGERVFPGAPGGSVVVELTT